MALYLVQASYSPEAVAALVKHPQDREPYIRSMVEKLGGQLLGLYFSLGEYDVIGLAEVPDDTTAMAAAMAITGAGHLQDYKTTKLISSQDMVQAMRKAGYVTFASPVGS